MRARLLFQEAQERDPFGPRLLHMVLAIAAIALNAQALFAGDAASPAPMADPLEQGTVVVDVTTVPLYGDAILRFRDSGGKVVKEIKIERSHSEVQLPAGKYTLEAQYSNDIDAGYRKSVVVIAGERTDSISFNLDYSTAHWDKWVNMFKNKESARSIERSKADTIEAYNEKSSGQRTAGWTTLLGGIGISALASAAYLIGSQSYGQYQNAATSSDAAQARSQAETWSQLFTGGAVAGGSLLVASSFIWLAFVLPSASQENHALKAFDDQIQKLQMQDNSQAISAAN